MSAATATATTRRMERDFMPRNLAFNMPAWKIGLGQDIVILGVLAGLCLLFPRNFIYNIDKFVSNRFLSIPSKFVLVQSDTANLLLQIIGTLALGYCYVLYTAIRNNDINVAVATAWYHVIVAVLGTYTVWSGGPIMKILLPFIAHDIMSALFLFSSVPNSSALWNVLSKLHLA